VTRPILGEYGTAIVALDGIILECDAVYAAIMGVPRADLVGRSVSGHADVQSGYSPAFMIDLLLRTRQPLLTVRDYVRQDGSKMLCEVQLCLLKNAGLEPDRIFVLVQPTRSQAKAALPSIDRPPPNA
jgi:PAS domain-containing protein